MNAVAHWADKWRMSLAADKCSTTLFTTTSVAAPRTLNIKLHGQTLPTDRNPKFLGITYDRLLSFTEHAKNASTSAKKRCGILGALSGSSWGPKWQDLRALYLTYVRPVLEYAGGAWMPGASQTAIKHLDTAQRSAARIITGCTRNTRAEVLEREAHVLPMNLRAEQLAAELYEKALRLPQDNPVRGIAEADVPRKRDGMLRLSSVKAWRETGRAVTTELDLDSWPRDQLRPYPPVKPWDLFDEEDLVRINTTLVSDTRRTDAAEVRKEAATRTLAQLPEARTHVWTDGAAREGIFDGGGGVIIDLDDGTLELAIPAGRHTSSFRAEMLALEAALAMCLQHDVPGPIRVCTDSLSSLQILQKGPLATLDPATGSVWLHLNLLAETGKAVTLQWVPGHAGIDGNERVDAVAKSGCEEDQRLCPVSMGAAKRLLARHTRKKHDDDYKKLYDSNTSASVNWHYECTKGRLPTPPIDTLSRSDQRIVCQMRAANSPHTASFLHLVGKCPSPKCEACGADEETVRHLLLDCPAWIKHRMSRWGPTPNPEEIFEDPQKLVGFLARIGRIGR